MIYSLIHKVSVLAIKLFFYFFAKSTLFNSRLKKRILTRLNLVPVYRKIDSEKNMEENINSFNKGYEILENSGAFLIFPEGVSIGKRVL